MNRKLVSKILKQYSIADTVTANNLIITKTAKIIDCLSYSDNSRSRLYIHHREILIIFYTDIVYQTLNNNMIF